MSGKVVWHDLNTRDTAKAKAFYGGVFGWQIRSREMGETKHDFLYLGEEGFGCLVKQEDKDPMPPHWVGYVQVDDLDAAVKRVKRGGGSAPVPRMAITDKDAFAILVDPLGATFAAYTTANPLPPGYPKQGAGLFCWEELLTTDPKRMLAFYGEVFGWTNEAVQMPMGTYHILKAGDAHVGGVMQMPPGAPAKPHWLSYVATDDVDRTAAKAAQLGAKSCVPPTDIPNIGRFSVLADPQGAVFAVYKSAARNG
jgi:predicted enzyme related to lactoylglutathione lyase